MLAFLSNSLERQNMKKFLFTNVEQLQTVLADMHANNWKAGKDFLLQANVLTIFNIDLTEAVYFEQQGGVETN